MDLYKYMFPPDNAHPTLCVIGLFQALGALMPICEVQCRLATAVFTGKVRSRIRAGWVRNRARRGPGLGTRNRLSPLHVFSNASSLALL